MIVDQAEAAACLGIGHRPEPAIGRGAVYAIAHDPLGLDPFRGDRTVPEAHRLGEVAPVVGTGASFDNA
jgi:hypothetical protein